MGKEWDRLGDVGKTSHSGIADEASFKGFRLPNYSGSSNAKCRACRKWKWDHEGRKCECAVPDFPNVKAHQARLMADWHQAWATEALRVLKPGGHLLAFGGTRTWHRLAVAIEDAGFEVRDSIAWMYGSGFPKSLDVSKAIDRKRDDTQDIHNVVRWLEARRQDAGVTRAQVEQHFGTQNIGQALFTITSGSASRVATWNQWLELKSLLGFGDDMDAEVWRLNGRKGQPGEAWAEREITGHHANPDPRLTTWAEMQGNPRGTAKERRDIPATPRSPTMARLGHRTQARVRADRRCP
jgi:hypothetical protein